MQYDLPQEGSTESRFSAPSWCRACQRGGGLASTSGTCGPAPQRPAQGLHAQHRNGTMSSHVHLNRPASAASDVSRSSSDISQRGGPRRARPRGGGRAGNGDAKGHRMVFEACLPERESPGTPPLFLHRDGAAQNHPHACEAEPTCRGGNPGRGTSSQRSTHVARCSILDTTGRSFWQGEGREGAVRGGLHALHEDRARFKWHGKDVGQLPCWGAMRHRGNLVRRRYTGPLWPSPLAPLLPRISLAPVGSGGLQGLPAVRVPGLWKPAQAAVPKPAGALPGGSNLSAVHSPAQGPHSARPTLVRGPGGWPGPRSPTTPRRGGHASPATRGHVKQEHRGLRTLLAPSVPGTHGMQARPGSRAAQGKKPEGGLPVSEAILSDAALDEALAGLPEENSELGLDPGAISLSHFDDAEEEVCPCGTHD